MGSRSAESSPNATGQIGSGIRTVLSRPLVYDALQKLAGARRMRRELAACFIRAEDGDRILDVGCGTAGILEALPNVEYVGFDINGRYIAAARARYGHRGQFICGEARKDMLEALPRFDLVLAIGLLHHLTDEDAAAFFDTARGALRPGGRVVSIDPVFFRGQNQIVRFLIARDRGQHVRTENAYRALAQATFSDVRCDLRHQRWIPYSQLIMDCTGAGRADCDRC